jgi:hypothetical protein
MVSFADEVLILHISVRVKHGCIFDAVVVFLLVIRGESILGEIIVSVVDLGHYRAFSLLHLRITNICDRLSTRK